MSGDKECKMPEIVAAYFPSPWEIDVLMISCTLLAIQGIGANLVILKFYAKEQTTRRIVPYLYKVISTFDLLSGITGFFNAKYFSLLKSPDFRNIVCESFSTGTAIQSKLLFVISYVMTAYFSVTTAFLHITLTVVRCINISRPFYSVVKGRIKQVFAFYLTFMMAGLLAETIYVINKSYLDDRDIFESYVYYTIFVRIPSFLKLKLIEDNNQSVTFILHIVIDLVIPYIIPCILCTICLIIQITTLTTNSCSSPHKKRQHITTTIALVTALFVLCNAFQITIISAQHALNKAHATTKWVGKTAAVVFPVVPLFNSAVDPLIFIMRSKALKKSIRDMCSRVWTSVVKWSRCPNPDT